VKRFDCIRYKIHVFTLNNHPSIGHCVMYDNASCITLEFVGVVDSRAMRIVQKHTDLLH
jgi:hypothetical protein